MRYIIHGAHPEYGSEDLDEADDRAEAETLAADYRVAFGPEWRITIRRV